jgi:hypothetical protein
VAHHSHRGSPILAFFARLGSDAVRTIYFFVDSDPIHQAGPVPTKLPVDSSIPHQLLVSPIVDFLDFRDHHQRGPHLMYALIDSCSIIIESKICLEFRDGTEENEGRTSDMR